MFAIVGLGNPGKKYIQTRHNVGFWAVDKAAAFFGCGPIAKEKFSCLYTKTSIAESSCVIAKPQKFMNLSGEAIMPFLSDFGVSPTELIVVYDEIELEPGKIRIKFGGGSAGHNGIKDICRALGTDSFYRIRIGVGHPRNSEETAGNDVSSWVLSPPRPEQKELIDEAVEKIPKILTVLLRSGIEEAQRLFNG